MIKVTFKLEDMDGMDCTPYSTTKIVGYANDTIDEVLLQVVRGLEGHTFPESLITNFINYDSDNGVVDKIV